MNTVNDDVTLPLWPPFGGLNVVLVITFLQSSVIENPVLAKQLVEGYNKRNDWSENIRAIYNSIYFNMSDTEIVGNVTWSYSKDSPL